MINGIQLQFSDGINTYKTGYNGGAGNSSSTFVIPTGQLITSIYICYESSNIFRLQFITYQGINSQLFGNALYCAGSGTFISLPGGLIGIGGYTSGLVNGIYFAQKEATSLTTTSNTGITTGFLSYLFFFEIKIIYYNFFLANFYYLGCFKACNGGSPCVQDLNKANYSSSAMTLQSCAIFCVNNGYSYFGLQNGYFKNFIYKSTCFNSLNALISFFISNLCFCDSHAATQGPIRECFKSCTRNSSQLCGAIFINSVYQIASCIIYIYFQINKLSFL